MLSLTTESSGIITVHLYFTVYLLIFRYWLRLRPLAVVGLYRMEYMMKQNRHNCVSQMIFISKALSRDDSFDLPAADIRSGGMVSRSQAVIR